MHTGGKEMFDKLIESNETAADLRPRRRYFMLTSMVVGILFITAVAVSLYAQDLDLGTDQFEISMLLAPVAPETPKPPDAPATAQASSPQASNSKVAIRREVIQRIEEIPSDIPPISSVPSSYLTRPIGDFRIDPNGIESAGPGVPSGDGAGRGKVKSSSVDDSSGNDSSTSIAKNDEMPEPPPLKKTIKPVIQSKGVMNGYAIDLPKPPYSAAAKAVNAQGEVSIQVLIDENGQVVSAKAVKGHVLLKRDAENAAWKAKFRPTYLSGEAVKVTGVIVYRFIR